MDHTGKPFFAGTYFPKRSRYGMIGLVELLEKITEQWQTNKTDLVDFGEVITTHIKRQGKRSMGPSDSNKLINDGIAYYKSAFDNHYGGFGKAPKFPMPHSVLFLLEAYENLHDKTCLDMAEKTLLSMAKGGIYDHIGFGFSRYSTDNKWLAPHFEKMLYDNALLIMAYAKAYKITKKPIYKTVIENTILYIEREMTHPQGGFYSAQDADSDGVEGKYYVFTPQEVISVLGEQAGEAFCKLYDITEAGNFEGKSIPNQIGLNAPDDSLMSLFPKLYEYRRTRTTLHNDDKILSAWNGLMIAALADASIILGNESYLETAKRAVDFIITNLCENDQVFTSFREGKRTKGGVLDDYAFVAYALLRMHNALPESQYLALAKRFIHKTIADFFDNQNGGFYLTSGQGENLILRPKETYDNAIPSGNSVMAMNLLYLNLLTGEYADEIDKQFDFMMAQAADAPGGYAFLLYGLLKRDFAERDSRAYVCDESGCKISGDNAGL